MRKNIPSETDTTDTKQINQPNMVTSPILTVDNLQVILRTSQHNKVYSILKNIHFCMDAEVVALIGESGSGKSTLAKAIVGILPPNMILNASKMQLSPTLSDISLNLLDLNIQKKVRGQSISMIMQDPKYALNPALTLQKQLEYAYKGSLKAEARQRYFSDLLASVELNTDILARKPAALSGGMGQRYMIALALLNQPKLIIADEPTSALDADMKQQVMELLVKRCQMNQIGLLLISHDLVAVQTFADKILIMKSGEIVDSGDANTLQESTHPYTRLLWSCRPSGATYKQQLSTSAN